MPDDVSDILEKYAPKQPGGDGDVSDILAKYSVPDEVLNEQHPGLSTLQRARLTNLAPDPDSARKDLLSKGWEVGGQGDDLQIRKPGERPWRRVDPQGLDWGDFVDVGDELVSGVATGVGSVAGFLGGAPTGPGAVLSGMAGGAAGAGIAEAGRRSLGSLAGFEQTPQSVVTGIGTEALMGAGAELGGQLIGKGIRGARNMLRGPPVPAAAPPAGLLKPIAAEAGEAAGTKPEVQAFKEALTPGAAPREAMEEAPGLLKTPEELDALLKPEDPYHPSYRVRQRPHEPTTPPGIDPNWTPGHQAGGKVAREIQEAGRHAPPASPHGPVTLATSSRDQVRKLLKDAGDDDMEIFYLAKGEGDTTRFRHFKSARLSEKAPKFSPMDPSQTARHVVLEGKDVGARVLKGNDAGQDYSIGSQLKELSDADLTQLAKDQLQKKATVQKAKLTKAEQRALYEGEMDYLSRAEIEKLVWGSQPGVVKGKHGHTPHRGEAWYQEQALKHNTIGLWEQTGKELAEGDWRSVNADKVLEIRNKRTGEVFRFSEEGKPVRAGTIDEIPPPTEVVTSPERGAPPQVFKLEEEGAAAAPVGLLKSGPGAPVKPQGAAQPGPIGKAARFGEGLLNIPKGIAGGIQKMTGLGPTASKGLLMGADFMTTDGVGTAARVGGGLAVKGMKRVDALLQPGGIERALASAPPAVRPALQSIQHAIETRGEQAGIGAIYISVRSAVGSDLREWLEEEPK